MSACQKSPGLSVPDTGAGQRRGSRGWRAMYRCENKLTLGGKQSPTLAAGAGRWTLDTLETGGGQPSTARRPPPAINRPPPPPVLRRASARVVGEGSGRTKDGLSPSSVRGAAGTVTPRTVGDGVYRSGNMRCGE